MFTSARVFITMNSSANFDEREFEIVHKNVSLHWIRNHNIGSPYLPVPKNKVGPNSFELTNQRLALSVGLLM